MLTVLWQGFSIAGMKQFLNFLAASWQKTLQKFSKKSYYLSIVVKALVCYKHRTRPFRSVLGGLETGISYLFLNLLSGMRCRYTGICVVEMADAKRKWPDVVSGKV